jgi:hypothetical protein
MPWGDINLGLETYQNAIDSRIGQFPIWHAVWTSHNFFGFRVDTRPWVYAQYSIPAAEPTELSPGLNDGDHILLFPQDQAGLCPFAWVAASWPYLEKFRSNFGFHFEETLLYRRVTLIGRPLGTRLGISQEIEDELRKASWRQVERIPCANSSELAAVLQSAIDSNTQFPLVKS